MYAYAITNNMPMYPVTVSAIRFHITVTMCVLCVCGLNGSGKAMKKEKCQHFSKEWNRRDSNRLIHLTNVCHVDYRRNNRILLRILFTRIEFPFLFHSLFSLVRRKKEMKHERGGRTKNNAGNHHFNCHLLV